ncbi:hypothetical protein [Cellulomonas sp. Y8]|uniref:hypothetical protein n=1 Tax=Cellulomonas sp. Y8 TaxID=2591145 RepID=UPI0011C77A94|nr:hypothetical protein [Cellulomonas sp. Y8]
MDDTPDDNRGGTAPALLTLTITQASGMYRISSAGTTKYYLDLGSEHLVVRACGAGSGRFPFDNEWSTLLSVSSYNLSTRHLDHGTIRVGERPRYTFDPGPTWPDHEWRWQRIVESIELLPPHEAATTRTQFPRALQGGPA